MSNITLFVTERQASVLRELAREGALAEPPRVLSILAEKGLAKRLPGSDRFAPTRAGLDIAAGLRGLAQESEPLPFPSV